MPATLPNTLLFILQGSRLRYGGRFYKSDDICQSYAQMKKVHFFHSQCSLHVAFDVVDCDATYLIEKLLHNDKVIYFEILKY